jgi:hypothetical protein
MDGIKMVVLSVWSMSHANIRKGQVGITRKGCAKGLDPKVPWRGCVMLGMFGMPSTPTTEKEAFSRGPTYLVKTDLDAPVSRKKEICFPDTIPVTHGSVDSPVAGAL